MQKHKEIALAITRTKEQYAKTDGQNLTSQIKHLQAELKNVVENIQQKEYNADSISQEINSIDNEIRQTISDLEKLQAITNDQVNGIDREIDNLKKSSTMNQ